MDPRRILLRVDPGRPGIVDLIERIPGVREVILIGDGSLDLPEIRIRNVEGADPAGSKATLVIAGISDRVQSDLLLIPPMMPDDERQLTDHLLIWMGSDQRSYTAVTGFLDQISTNEILLLTEGEAGSDIALHAKMAVFSRMTVSGDPVQALLDVVSASHPTLIMISRRFRDPDLLRLFQAKIPVFIPFLKGGPIEVRELGSAEFPDADRVWVDYHETTGDPEKDRIFAAFEGDEIVSLARCRRHPDSYEVDAVFTPETCRGRGLSRLVMGALAEACYNEELSMYAVQHLKKFYSEFGFIPVPEGELPASVRERYLWAAGNMEGAEVIPMKRPPGRPAFLTGRYS